MNEEKRRIVEEMDRLAREQTPRWALQRRKLMWKLARLDDPYGKHESHGNERSGRHGRSIDSPTYDSMDDESRP
jgi:hypothetical protein